jgi:serine/threonine protein kinase
MPLDALAHVGRSISLALMYLHEDVAVVHRDVKPGNILLSSSGEVKLADLGICTRPGELQALSSAVDGEPAPATAWVGTVTYMSPERLTGSGYSFSADVWSLGIVLAEAAVGPTRSPRPCGPRGRELRRGRCSSGIFWIWWWRGRARHAWLPRSAFSAPIPPWPRYNSSAICAWQGREGAVARVSKGDTESIRVHDLCDAVLMSSLLKAVKTMDVSYISPPCAEGWPAD